MFYRVKYIVMETIAAISTPQGVGGISVIRLSGKEAKKVASKVFSCYGNVSFKEIGRASCRERVSASV